MPADFERRMATHQSHDNFLLHYARLMLTEDLLLFTNVAFVRPIEYLVPFAKLNKLSFISVMVHLYDASSYGNQITYESADPGDLKSILL
jgi:hypothetical protein